MSINFGKYDQLINVQSFVESENGDGSVTRAFTDLYTNIWSEVSSKSGVENNESDELVAITEMEFKVRLQGLTINKTMRIVWRDNTYSIISILPHGTRLNEVFKIIAVAKDNND
jgi:head-tail adaptor